MVICVDSRIKGYKRRKSDGGESTVGITQIKWLLVHFVGCQSSTHASLTHTMTRQLSNCSLILVWGSCADVVHLCPALVQDTSTLASTGVNADATVDINGELALLHEHIAACSAASDRLSSLIPCLESDLATTRLVVALSAVEIGIDLGKHVPEGMLPSAFQHLSTADVP